MASTAALVLLGGGIGSAAAAQQAMPGDTLYGMKRSIENVSTNVSVGDDSRGRRDLEHAMTRLSEVQELAGNGGSVGTINATLDDFSAQSRKGVSRLVASYQQDGDETSITAITAFITSARQALVGLAPKLPPESLKSGVEALATIEQLAQHTSAACPKCAAPKPGATTPSTGHQPNRTTPGTGTEPSDPIQASTSQKASTTVPTPGASTTAVEPSTSPTKLPNTTIVEESNTPPPTILKTPPRPSPSNSPTTTPTVLPSLTPTTPSWPWPFPTTPLINLPGIIQTLFPPWK
ncbi:DUF5667 domain-containing protein [Kribbella sp. NPDC054772]